MDSYIERTWVEIDIDAMIESCRVIREEMIPENTKVMAVLKSDAYGHGAGYLAPILQKECQVDWFAVACLSEAIELRQHGVTLPILILGLTDVRYVNLLEKYQVSQTIGSLEYAKALNDEARKNHRIIDGHLKINTGMNRLGFGDGKMVEATVAEVLQIKNMSNINITGMYSHLFHSLVYDELSKETCYRQYDYFNQIRKALEKQGMDISLCHLCNTGGVINYPELAMDMIRVGSLLWGLKGVQPQIQQKWQPPLKPVFQLKSRVGMVRSVKKGESIGYSFAYVAKKDMKIAVISCGYTDGYSRENSNHGYVLIRGQRVRIIGNICMDMMLADVTDLEIVCMGDLVTIYGKD